MKVALLALFLAVSAFAQDAPAIVAAACGPKNVRFDVKLGGFQQAQAQSETANATVYFIQDDGPDGNHQHATLRIGLDGAWVGAYRKNSYFTVSVGPGEHHVCANVQSDPPEWRHLALAHFTAEPGKVYYFRTKFLAGLTTVYPIHPYLELDQPDSDQARYLIATYPLSVSRPRK
jgi:hypothetical protein